MSDITISQIINSLIIPCIISHTTDATWYSGNICLKINLIDTDIACLKISNSVTHRVTTILFTIGVKSITIDSITHVEYGIVKHESVDQLSYYITLQSLGH